MTAITAWQALLREGATAVPEAVEALWADLAAEAPLDRASNDWLVFGSRLDAAGFPTMKVSPYDTPASGLGREQFRRILVEHIEFETLPERCAGAPRLVVGTVDVNGGCFEAFVDEEITADVVLASAAVPDLFRAVEMNGHWHWDGLFSQNPPVHELLHVPPERKPEELWIVQINPQTREGEPRSSMEIADRRNELAGNISLNQELQFVERVNDWVAAGHLPADEFVHTEVRRLELDTTLDAASKLDRTPAFIEDLIDRGRQRAQRFLDGL